jgi:uncharacterized membrane protein
VAKALYFSSQNTVNCYKSFCSVSKFLITNTIFFLSWNICSIIPLISITYLALVHNYNIIKCICFINPRQHAGMSSRIIYKWVLNYLPSVNTWIRVGVTNFDVMNFHRKFDELYIQKSTCIYFLGNIYSY